jgi:hypothetical protein
MLRPHSLQPVKLAKALGARYAARAGAAMNAAAAELSIARLSRGPLLKAMVRASDSMGTMPLPEGSSVANR